MAEKKKKKEKKVKKPKSSKKKGDDYEDDDAFDKVWYVNVMNQGIILSILLVYLVKFLEF